MAVGDPSWLWPSSWDPSWPETWQYPVSWDAAYPTTWQRPTQWEMIFPPSLGVSSQVAATQAQQEALSSEAASQSVVF